MIQQTQSRLLIGKRQHAQWEERRASPRVIAALGAVAETWETLMCRSARGRHKKVRQIHTVECDAAIKKEQPSPWATRPDGPTEGTTE